MVVKIQQVVLPRGFSESNLEGNLGEILKGRGCLCVRKAIPPIKVHTYRIPLSNAPRSL